MVLSVLNYAIPCLMVIVVLCIYGMKRLQLRSLQLSSDDELYRVPYGVKFLPDILNYGAKVIYNKQIYEVSSVVVMVINCKRWLFYRLRSCDDGSKAALSVATRDGKLRLCWWWGDENKQRRAMNDSKKRSALIKKFGGGRYARETWGDKRFISLGSTECPPYAVCRHELLERVPLLSKVADSPRWLLSLSWDRPGKNFKEMFISECMGMDDVVIRPSAVQRPGIEPGKFSKAIICLEKVNFASKVLAFTAMVALLYYLELIPEWLIEDLIWFVEEILSEE